MIRRGLARHDPIDDRRKAGVLGPLALGLTLRELGHDLAREQLQRLQDVLVAVPTARAREDHLVDAARLVAPQVVADLSRGTGGTAQPGHAGLDHLRAQPRLVARGERDGLGGVALLRSSRFVVRPEVAPPRLVAAEHVVVAERVADEVRAVRTPSDRFLLVVVAEERRDARDVGVHRATFLVRATASM